MEKSLLIIGYGASGKALEALVKKQGFTSYIYDDNSLDHPQKIHLEDLINLPISQALLSPGIPLDHPACKILKNRSIRIRGEAEYALSFLPHKKVAITGTNGKTTVTFLCEHILKRAGFSAIACGNVAKDKSLSSIVDKVSLETILVCELSSFQLETLESCQFETGIILNITPDHLDRYPDMNGYAAAKFRLQNLSKTFFLFDEIFKKYPQDLHEGTEVIKWDESADFLEIDFENNLDKINAYSAYLVLRPFNIPDSIFKEAVKDFKKPHHRMEKVLDISGIEFINDSKATNIDATIWAIKSLNKPTILLAGGVDKGHPYLDWIPYLKNIKMIICFGASKDLIFTQLSTHVRCEKKQTLAEAVAYAYDQAQSGDIILLSPGCSSFDEFKDYADRGIKFCQNVLNLTPKETKL
jgi:UDP-N-acetylmuramoylalanine--D-glutamate ligase